MTPLQVETASKVIENSFNTSPDTVFGVLVSILSAICLGLFLYVRSMVKTHREDLNQTHVDHKAEMKEIFEKHEAADTQKYNDMKEVSKQMIEASSVMLSKIDELIRRS